MVHEDGIREEIPALNFSDFLAQNFRAEDTVIVRCDIEGAEYARSTSRTPVYVLHIIDGLSSCICFVFVPHPYVLCLPPTAARASPTHHRRYEVLKSLIVTGTARLVDCIDHTHAHTRTLTHTHTQVDYIDVEWHAMLSPSLHHLKQVCVCACMHACACVRGV